MAHLSKSFIANLSVPVGKSDHVVFDDDLPGLAVRVRAGGSKSFVLQYRVGKKQRRLKLGSTRQLGLDEARRLARTALARITLGSDPQADKQKSKARAVNTIGAVSEIYLSTAKAKLKPRYYLEVERHLKKAWKPIHGRALYDLSRADVASELRTIAKVNGLVAADRARASLSAMTNWAVREGMIETNVVLATNKYAGTIERDRVLTDDELSEIWHACLDDDHGFIVKLLMLMPARRQEIGSMAWPEIDPVKRVWTLPAARSKNRRQHTMPLADDAWTMLQSILKRSGRSLVFGRSAGGYSGWGRSKEVLDRRILTKRLEADPKALPLKWRLHDLRRTCATRLAESGTQPHIVETLLNHVSGHKAGVAGVYNRALYEPAKRKALELWESHLRNVIIGTTPIANHVTTDSAAVDQPPPTKPAKAPGDSQPELGPGRRELVLA